MAKLTDDDRAALAALLAKADEEDDFEVEIFSGDKGARMPYSQAKDWLAKEFGIGATPAGDQGGQGAPQGGQGAPRPLSLFRSRGNGQGAPQGGQGAPQGGQGAPQGGQGQQG